MSRLCINVTRKPSFYIKDVINLAKFVFKMQQLLNIKKQLEDTIKNQLGAAIRKLEKEKEYLKKLESEKMHHINCIRQSMQEGISVHKLLEFNVFLDSFEHKINNQKKVINDAKVVADKIRERLVQVVKEKKMLEILREKKLQDHRISEQRKEQLALGEIANYKYIEHKAGEANGSYRTDEGYSGD